MQPLECIIIPIAPSQCEESRKGKPLERYPQEAAAAAGLS